jgi:signal transduction histidine kinase
VRREVSQRLHGGLQQRLVVAVIELDAIQRTLEEHGESALARTVHELTATLDTLREREVRGLAHGLYPLAADLDLDDALALLADRLPPSVRLGVGYGPGTRSLLAEGPGPTLAAPDRVALFATVEEGVTNALRHGQAHRIEVAIDAEAEGPGGEGLGHDGDDGPPGDTVVHVTVDDDGAGLPDPAVALSGLVPQRARARRRGGDLMLGPSPLGGVRLDLRLPVHLVRDEVEGLR